MQRYRGIYNKMGPLPIKYSGEPGASMSKNKKPKFNQIWSNQTNLGKRFGLSAIAVGKLLTEAGLKDPNTKEATEKAIEEGYAKATPLKDGTPYFMWNNEKVKPLIAKDHTPLNRVDYWANEVRKIIKEANKQYKEGNYKMGTIMHDGAYEEVPKDIRDQVRAIIEKDQNDNNQA